MEGGELFERIQNRANDPFTERGTNFTFTYTFSYS